MEGFADEFSAILSRQIDEKMQPEGVRHVDDGHGCRRRTAGAVDVVTGGAAVITG